MGKPRVIIADCDECYIATLQLKFIEYFFDKIDLEIITDKAYFEKVFSNPQKMDILIVSEELYNPALQRHNIGNIFVMTEQPENGSTTDLTVISIFKYTNVKEVFNEIIGSSTEVLRVHAEEKKQTQTILVYSASGGAGKTTVALGIATCLAQAHKKILYIDAEYIQNFQHFMKDCKTMPNTMIQAFKIGNERIFDDVQSGVAQEIFYYLPPFQASISSYSINFSVFTYLIDQIKKTNYYDFIVVDTDSSFSDDKGDIIDRADKVFIITRQDIYSVFKTNCMLKNINYSDAEKFMFLCSAFKTEYDNAILNPECHSTFMINEYIQWIPECEKMKLTDLAKIDGLQKIAYSLL